MLTKKATEIFIGSMLGDGTMWCPHKKASFCISRKLDDIKYLQYQFEHFKKYCKTGIVTKSVYDKRTRKYYHKCYFHTLTNQIFSDLYQRWYPNRKKEIPEDLKLTPLICAIWFCDDGCISIRKNSLALKLSTHGFTKNEVEKLALLLCQELHEYYFVCQESNKEQFIICSGTNGSLQFINYIDHFMPKGMNRKRTWENVDIGHLSKTVRKSNKLSKLERLLSLYKELKKQAKCNRIDIANAVDLLCFNKRHKSYYLRQDFVKVIENLVNLQILGKENNNGIKYYYIIDHNYFEHIEKEMSHYV